MEAQDPCSSNTAMILKDSFSLYIRMPGNKGKVMERLTGQAKRCLIMVHNRRSATSGGGPDLNFVSL